MSITYVTNAFSKKFGSVYKRCGRGVKKAQGVAECLGLASSIYPTCENVSSSNLVVTCIEFTQLRVPDQICENIAFGPKPITCIKAVAPKWNRQSKKLCQNIACGPKPIKTQFCTSMACIKVL